MLFNAFYSITQGTKMPSKASSDTWRRDQVDKSHFFHQKMHEWGLLEVADALDSVQGEDLDWENRPDLGITTDAWNKTIHRGIKPVLVFAHPDILMSVDRGVSYYRMLAMVSQKSMKRVGIDLDRYEQGKALLDESQARQAAQHLNRIVSALIESDEVVDIREIDLWRAMAAGTQAQGSWQNIKGDRAEVLIKGAVLKRLREMDLIARESEDQRRFELVDDRVITYADEPDIGIFLQDIIQVAIEIKGGIDTAGVLERIGAALKSLGRAAEENKNAVTILLLTEVSLSSQAQSDLLANRTIVNHWFTVEQFLDDDEVREKVFQLMGI